MKRFRKIGFFLMLSFLLLTGCQKEKDQKSPKGDGTSDQGDPSQSAGMLMENLVLVDLSAEGEMLFATRRGSETNGLYRALVSKVDKIKIDGEDASMEKLKNGMYVSIHYVDAIQELHPALFGRIKVLEASTPPVSEFPDLCGLYRKVLDDLWETDQALNGKTVAFNLSEAPGNLSQGQQEAIIYLFRKKHAVDTLHNVTQEELKEGGYLVSDPSGHYYWKDGCTLTITGTVEVGTKPKIFFNASKWSSPLGAYFFQDCECEWDSLGNWGDYTIGNQMISKNDKP